MAIVTIKASKATPGKALNFTTNKGKVAFVNRGIVGKFLIMVELYRRTKAPIPPDLRRYRKKEKLKNPGIYKEFPYVKQQKVR